ncbi:MAG: recombinase family protein [Mediterraneibacter sp.]|mgnify:FL=1
MFVSKEKYRACIYTRLSKDDGDKPESDSIGNQKALIRDFIKNHPEIEVVSEKADDGYSGVNFERPGFKEMMDEIRAGQVDCVIVKDLSRFGRNYIEAGNYIERVFPFIGVRFIAINDSYDSKDQNQSDSLIIPFKNLINDAYCKDISVKIRTQLDIKRKKGEFIGAFAAYGYLKDPEDHNKLIVDTFASEVVRAIFRWKLEGLSQGDIADRLNAQGVLCPMEYKLSLGMKVQTNFRANRKAVWSWSSVSRILTNEIYTGVLVQGKVSTPNYKVKKFMEKDESEWIRVEQSHEAIIDEDTFRVTQELLKKDVRRGPERGRVYPLSGYLVCADCGQNMIRKSAMSGGKKYFYYVCSGHKARNDCKPHSIREEELFDGVLMAMQGHVKVVADLKKMMETLRSLPEEQRNVVDYDVQIVKLKEEIERNQEFKMKLYDNLQDGLINQDEYFLFKKTYSERIADAEKAIKRLEQEREDTVSRNASEQSWAEVFLKYRNLTEIDRKAVVDLVEEVHVYEDKRIVVKFRYMPDFEKILKMVSALPSGMPGEAV